MGCNDKPNVQRPKDLRTELKAGFKAQAKFTVDLFPHLNGIL